MKYPIVLLEDPFEQNDCDAFAELKKHCDVELVGGDLLATSMNRMKTAEEKRAWAFEEGAVEKEELRVGTEEGKAIG